MKALALIGSVDDAAAVGRLHAQAQDRRLRISRAAAARDARHDDADFRQRLHRALSRPGTDEPCALCRGRLSPRQSVSATEAGLKYFVLGALSSGMLLYGVSLMYGYSGTVSFAGVAGGAQGSFSDRRHLRAGVRAGGPRVQDFRRAVPHVDARRLRGRADAGDDVLRLRAQDGRDGGSRAGHA